MKTTLQELWSSRATNPLGAAGWWRELPSVRSGVRALPRIIAREQVGRDQPALPELAVSVGGHGSASAHNFRAVTKHRLPRRKRDILQAGSWGVRQVLECAGIPALWHAIAGCGLRRSAELRGGDWERPDLRSRPAQWFWAVTLLVAVVWASPAIGLLAAENSTPVELKNLTVQGGIDEEQARLIIQANLKGPHDAAGKAVVATTIEHLLETDREWVRHSCRLTCDVLQGEAKEILLGLGGAGEITGVQGDGLLDWGIRQEPGGARFLVLRPKKADKVVSNYTAVVQAETRIRTPGELVQPLVFTSPQSSLMNGYLRVQAGSGLAPQLEQTTGMVPVELKYLPTYLREVTSTNELEPLAFQFHGSAYSLALKVAEADPEARQVVLAGFQLTGNFKGDQAEFDLRARARVRNPKGGSIPLLSGAMALTAFEPVPGGRLEYTQGGYRLRLTNAGEFPLNLKFHAAVVPEEGWKSVHFKVATSPLQPVVLRGLTADTQFRFAGAAQPEWGDGEFHGYLPANGEVKLTWKEARTETEGKLFFSTEMLSQIAISPGLMRQWAGLEGRVMQGELTQLVLNLKGAGEVVRVQGEPVLSWAVEALPGGPDRRLIVKFNQPIKEHFGLQIQLQTPLGAFPQAFDAVQVRPVDATRFAGYYRIASEGAVRLEVIQATGISQISPEQVPAPGAGAAQPLGSTPTRFAFRFSGGDHGLRIQADNILPELAVSQLVVYHLGETESTIDAELELEVREAALRELLLRVPQGYGIARLAAPGMSDYFSQADEASATVQLRLVYAQPVTGRQVVQLRLERNQTLGETAWVLPHIDLPRAKSVRGYLGVTADPGYRLTPASTDGLTEIATAFFPKKLVGIQTAFRLNDPAWRASLRVERLPQTVQADALHLFSIGEGIAYGSSIMNYIVSGAPRATFKLELSEEYSNIEFTGKDIRSWRKVADGYEIQLHTPVGGAYNLLATYERSFKAQGETLTFTGARPLETQSEQGHTVVVSTYQFQVRPVNVSPGLLPLEPGEVPAEYRLFFDAPILAAYRYTSRPFQLQLALSPLVQGQTLSLVVDRASLNTRISKEGQLLTDARYLIKNRGQSHFRLTLPPETQLWSATVNGAPAVPIADGSTNLIPLPAKTDPSAVQVLEFKLAARSKDARRIRVAAPLIQAPVLLAEWKLSPESSRRLVFESGTLTPTRQTAEITGYANLVRLVTLKTAPRVPTRLAAALALVLVALGVWKWSGRPGIYRYSLRHWTGLVVGLVAAGLALVSLGYLVVEYAQAPGLPPAGLVFLSPVQQTGSALQIQVLNVPDAPGVIARGLRAWPMVLAFGIWGYAGLTRQEWFRPLGRILGWLVLAAMVLRWSNGASWFFGIVIAFLLVHVIGPALGRVWRVPRKPRPESGGGAVATAAATVLIGLGTVFGWEAQAQVKPAPKENVQAESVVQKIGVKDRFISATAHIRWLAKSGQILPLMHAPGVMTQIVYPTNALRLFQATETSQRTLSLLAQQAGAFDIELRYQLQTQTRDGHPGFVLPTQPGLVNRITLTVTNLEVEVFADPAIAVWHEPKPAQMGTEAQLVLSPAAPSWVGWKPRSRDTRHERAVFYAEIYQLYVPTAGVIEGVHQAQIRPAQGELSALEFQLPAGLTVTDVLPPRAAPNEPASEAATTKSIVSFWRFNPDTRILRIALNPPQSKPFGLVIQSQVAAGALPYEQTVGLISSVGAAGQIGLLGVATGNEVQLDGVQAENLSPISLEDFPALAQTPASRIGGVTLRRAYRYPDPLQQAVLKASAVEPDVRVEYQQTLSLGEDRTVLAVNARTAITRAGIFRLSFLLPAGLEIESITGGALSHWTELKTDAGRVITLHLRGKTEGEQVFDLSLSGPGQRALRGWTVPRFSVREAGKQRGQLVIVPEQGMRLQVGAREGITQLDPQKAGIQQKGVLAFRLLQESWRLVLDTELVDPWIQVTSLQQVQVSEALVKVRVNLQYQIENAGLKSFRVRLPAQAEGVRFQGEQVADFLARPGDVDGGLREWEIKLHRRMIGAYWLKASYQLNLPENSRQVSVQGLQAVGVNLQRGFLVIQADGRLQTLVNNLPAALQPAEWQSIPRALQQDLPAQSANHTFRLADPVFTLPVGIERHEAARLLPARINRVTMTSVVSDHGVMLTQVRLDMVPGDKRLLHLKLPTDAQFWFAFVNQNGVWPWREQEQILIPLEQQAKTGQDLVVEFFYSSRIGSGARTKLDLDMVGPQLDLPLENIDWRIYLDQKWQVRRWTGSMQLTQDRLTGQPLTVDMDAYLQNEVSLQRQKIKQAEAMIQTANSLLQQGDSQQARRAFQAAYGLSQHDTAFNEDARVQLHNLKTQQALMGLNFRNAAVAGDSTTWAARLRELRGGKALAYTQEEAKQIFDNNPAEENANLIRLAERLIQQQDAAQPSLSAIRATIPEQGRLLVFQRPVQVDPWADLRIHLQAGSTPAVSLAARLLVLLAIGVVSALLFWLARSGRATGDVAGGA